MKELLLHGFRKISPNGHWYQLTIDKADYGIHHNFDKHDWMIFQVSYSGDHYILDVYYDDRRNRHILYSTPQVLGWIKMYKKI